MDSMCLCGWERRSLQTGLGGEREPGASTPGIEIRSGDWTGVCEGRRAWMSSQGSEEHRSAHARQGHNPMGCHAENQVSAEGPAGRLLAHPGERRWKPAPGHWEQAGQIFKRQNQLAGD